MKKLLCLALILGLSLNTYAFDLDKVQNTVQLVNTENTLSQDYLPLDTVNLYANGIRVSNTSITARREAVIVAKTMLKDMAAEGITNYMVVSGYRGYEKQMQLFTNKIASYTKTGMSTSKAEAKAATSVAIPGTSEHQTGYVMDISTSGSALNSAQAKTSVAQWLASNSYKYGYVVRYPEGKTAITGIIYEPWHFRYVGLPHSQLIYDMKFCLEEYIEYLKGGEILHYTNDFGIDFDISYTTDLDSIDDTIGASVSKGDTAGYVVTVPIHNKANTVFRWN